MKQSEIYVAQEADEYFERNKKIQHNFFTEYLISCFPKKIFKNYSVAEFGVGRGGNIALLASYAKNVDAYDGSKKAIDNLKNLILFYKNIGSKQVNLCNSFTEIRKYDLIIYGFFIYMISDDELKEVKRNTLKMLKNNGYLFIYDFLSKKNVSKCDIHNKKLKVHKRNLNFYLDFFCEFDLVDFRLFDNRHILDYLDVDSPILIDPDISYNDYDWVFSALFKLKSDLNDI